MPIVFVNKQDKCDKKPHVKHCKPESDPIIQETQHQETQQETKSLDKAEIYRLANEIADKIIQEDRIIQKRETQAKLDKIRFEFLKIEDEYKTLKSDYHKTTDEYLQKQDKMFEDQKQEGQIILQQIRTIRSENKDLSETLAAMTPIDKAQIDKPPALERQTGYKKPKLVKKATKSIKVSLLSNPLNLKKSKK